jgi:hypothetical protein
MNRGQKRKGSDLLVKDVRAMLNRPSAIDQLENLLPNSALRAKLSTFLADPANTSLDVANRLIVGTQHAAGAYSDVFDGKLLSSHVDEKALRSILKNKERFRTH